MKEERSDLVQTVEVQNEYAVNPDENYEEQGYLWMCGICENGPTFENVHDLFAHKRDNSHLLQAKKRAEKTSCSSDPELHNAPPSPDVFYSTETNADTISQSSNEKKTDVLEDMGNSSPPPSPISSEDIPLSILSPKLNSVNRCTVSDVGKYLVTKKHDENDEHNELLVNKGLSGTVTVDRAQVNNEFQIVDNNGLIKTESTCENELITQEATRHEPNFEGEKENENNADDSSDEKNDDDDDEFKRSERPNETTVKAKTKHICKICNTEFPSRFALSIHKKTHLFKDTGCYKCETCGKMCPKYDNFTRHLTIHFENRKKSHQCSHCFASFYNLADLKRHLVLHLSVKPFTCEHCGEGFTRQDSLLIHAYKHTGVLYMKYACKDCDKVLNSQSALVMHVKTHSVKTVFCPEPGCKFSCYLQSQLKQHLRKHSGEKPFQCAKCGRCFARSNDMKNHVLSVHEGVKPFKCPACPKEFALVGNLRIHYTTHTNERPYLCAQCGKSFNHPSTLRKHSVTVHSPWRNQDKTSRSKKFSPNSVSQKNFDGKKQKGKRKEDVSPKEIVT